MESASNIKIEDLANDIMDDKFFGFVECDIDVTSEFMKNENEEFVKDKNGKKIHYYDHFSEMCPIFANKDVKNKEKIIGKYMINIIKNENSSKICKKMLNTSGCAFSISSNSTTL